jgi:hypothetical protein
MTSRGRIVPSRHAISSLTFECSGLLSVEHPKVLAAEWGALGDAGDGRRPEALLILILLSIIVLTGRPGVALLTSTTKGLTFLLNSRLTLL